MTTTDPSTTPAEAAREARARQAYDFLALAMKPEHMVERVWSVASQRSHYDYENGVQAVRDALVGQGHATLAVNANLDRIANALEATAKTPAAIQYLTDHVDAASRTVQDRLTDVGNELFDLRSDLERHTDATNSAVRSVTCAVHELADAVLRLSEPRPRWWQWRLRRALREAQATQTGIEPT